MGGLWKIYQQRKSMIVSPEPHFRLPESASRLKSLLFDSFAFPVLRTYYIIILLYYYIIILLYYYIIILLYYYIIGLKPGWNIRHQFNDSLRTRSQNKFVNWKKLSQVLLTLTLPVKSKKANSPPPHLDCDSSQHCRVKKCLFLCLSHTTEKGGFWFDLIATTILDCFGHCASSRLLSIIHVLRLTRKNWGRRPVTPPPSVRDLSAS